MILDSPQFLGLKIYVGQHPKPGSFYSPKLGDTLSHVANWAYGVGALSQVLKINKSLWNIDNCVYRRESTGCTSPVVVSELALSQSSWAEGAWIALCPGDRQPWSQALGLNYPVFWVPGVHGEEPEDLADEPIVLIKDPVIVPPISTIVVPPKRGVVPPIVSPITTKSKWPWILGAILILGVAGTTYYFYQQGKTAPKRAYAYGG